MRNQYWFRFGVRTTIYRCLVITALFVLAAGLAWSQVAATNSAPTMIWANNPDVTRPLTHMPAKVLNGTATLVGHYDPNQMLRLVLTIRAPHMAEEEQFIKELVTKGSPGFHKFLTQEEWNARFGPSVEDEQAVVDWAQSVGLTVTHRYPNRLLVDVEGTAGTTEKAFGVTINNYQVGEEIDFSNDREPVIPANLSGILQFVTGLNNVERPHRIGSSHKMLKGADYVPGPMISKAESVHGAGNPAKAPWARRAPITSQAAARDERGAPAKPKSNDSYPLDDKSGTYAMDPDNVQSSNGYDFNALQRLSFCCNEPAVSTGSPPESSIALVGYGGFNVSDVTTFFNAYGMAWNITWYCIGGSPCPSNDGEAPLDVEYSGAMSNSYGSYLNTAAIYEYEMTNNLYTTYEGAFNGVLSDGHAKVVSTSYGWEENVGFSGSVATGTMHPIFNNMVGVGITLIAASGDNGASDGCGNATAVDYPSSDPDFIAAGGTQLNMYSNGIFYSETAWQGENWSGACSSNHGGSTGGVSVLFTAPYWQTDTNSTYPTGVVSPFYLWNNGSEYVETGNTNRMVPDIALTANPDVLGEWYVSGGSWQDEGGTSIVAPELAGFFAQENSYLDYVGSICGSGSSPCSPVGLASPFIYYDALYGAPHNPFYDMLSGCSDNDVTATYSLFYFCAYSGYDPITGWGSANMMQLAWGINWEIIPANGVPSLSFGGPATYTWFNTDQIVDWDLTDGSSNGFTPPGNAGFTLGWDSIPSDSYSEPHGGDGDTFYTGPEYTYSGFGCVDNNGSICQAASGQGCHIVYVRGWDNQGNVTNGSYGPVCFDSIPPVTTAGLSGSFNGSVYISPVKVTLSASDPSPGSGVASTDYDVNGSAYVAYSSPFTINSTGSFSVSFYSTDVAGNVETAHSASFTIEAPTTTALTSSRNPSVYNESVTFKAVVAGTFGPKPTGTVTFKNGSAVLGTATLSAGVATFTTTALSAGTHSITALYGGSGANLASTSVAVKEVVSKANTTAKLVSSLNPSTHGKPVTFTATVTGAFGGSTTGPVKFEDGATVIGTANLNTTTHQAKFTTSTLSVGTHHIKAVYAGSADYNGSTSAVLSQVVK